MAASSHSCSREREHWDAFPNLQIHGCPQIGLGLQEQGAPGSAADTCGDFELAVPQRLGLQDFSTSTSKTSWIW